MQGFAVLPNLIRQRLARCERGDCWTPRHTCCALSSYMLQKGTPPAPLPLSLNMVTHDGMCHKDLENAVLALSHVSALACTTVHADVLCRQRGMAKALVNQQVNDAFAPPPSHSPAGTRASCKLLTISASGIGAGKKGLLRMLLTPCRVHGPTSTTSEVALWLGMTVPHSPRQQRSDGLRAARAK